MIVTCSCAASDGPEKSVVDHTLLELLEDFDKHNAKQAESFQASNTHLRIVDNFVLIDAIASDNAAELENDLRLLGATNLSSYGRTVSCFFPITNIAKLVALESLQFARPVIAITHRSD